MTDPHPNLPGPMLRRAAAWTGAVEELSSEERAMLASLERPRSVDDARGELPRAAAMRAIDSLVRKGAVEPVFETDAAELVAIEDALGALRRVSARSGDAAHRVAEAMERALYGDGVDELSPAADAFADAFDAVRPGARWLDAGGGVGRMAEPLLERGARVDLVDASADALRRAYLHLGAHTGLSLAHGLVEGLGRFNDARFDGALAIETLSYAADAPRALAEIRRVLRPGAPLLVSVESRAGAVLGDPKLTLEDVPEALANGRFDIAGFQRTRLWDADALGALLEGAGFEILWTGHSHHVAEGPLAHKLDAARLETDKAYRADVRALERRLRADPVLGPLGRVAVAHARRSAEDRP